MAQRLLFIGLAGALGTILRYLVGLLAAAKLGTAFPWGTFIVNVTGCFLIAVVMHLGLTMASFPETLRLTLTTGFMGGLTTYSSFNFETTRYVREGALGVAALNAGATFVACFVAGLLGLVLARRLVGG